MLRLASDENFNGNVVRGLRRRLPQVDIRRLQDAQLLGAVDPAVLEWAAAENRILLTHDHATMPDFAFERIEAGLGMPGVFVVPRRLGVGDTIDQLVLICACSDPDEWENRVVHLPL